MKLILSFLFSVCFVISASEHFPDEASVWEHVWVGDNITDDYKIRVDVPIGSMLYDVMIAAADEDSKFAFESEEFPNLGHFITAIGNNTQVPAENKYWMIYITAEAPKKNSPPGDAELSPFGVSNLVIQDGKHYLFWLKTVIF